MTDQNLQWHEKPLDRNVKIAFAVFTSREYSPLTTIVAQTDLKFVRRDLPTLQRAVTHAFGELDIVQNLPPGLEITSCQVEHELNHSIGAAALLRRQNELISDELFDKIGHQVSERAQELFSSALIQRTSSASAVQAQLGDINPGEAERFYSAFNRNFPYAAELSVHNPESGNEQAAIKVLAKQIEKPAAVSGKILEIICTVNRTRKTVAYVSILGKRGQCEIQFDDGSEAYALELVKRLGVSIQLKVAAVSFPGSSQIKQKYRFLEVLGVESGPWEEIASCFMSAAQFLVGCPAITAEKNNVDEHTVKNTHPAEPNGGSANPTDLSGIPKKSLPRRNRKPRNPL